MIVLLNVLLNLCPQEEDYTSFSWAQCQMYTPSTIAILQADNEPTKISKNNAVVKVKFLVELGIV